ncbi:hypothetical protein [Segatella hominis]|uniref:hypothetical protein n=1 Tax=Segatella hominis TaxID=2518605 RepID=UPI003AB959C3
MTRRNDKRNNRHNRQRNNKTEFSPFAQMIIGALLGKGAEMIAEKMAKEAKKTPDIHTEGITNKDINNINNGNATLSKLRIPADGSAVEYPIPDGLTFFFNEEGKLMVQKAPGDKNGEPITYDDICKKLFFNKTAYWVRSKNIEEGVIRVSYNDIDNCASMVQAKRVAAFNKLQNIAKYLNKGWKPNFCIGDKKWGIIKEGEGFSPKYIRMINDANIYFRDKDLANEAIRLMGEDSLNDLFSTDW